MEYVLITGASSGIGFELAKLFAKNDYGLAIVSSNSEKIELAKSSLQQMSNHKVYAYVVDLSVLGGAESLFNKVSDDSLDISILINNAGFGVVGRIENIDKVKNEKMMILNMISLVKLTELFILAMYNKQFGRILNVSSTGAFQPGPYTSTYFASKSFVSSFSQAINYEAKSNHVTVSTVYPGATRTNFFNQENVATPKNAMSVEKMASYTFEKFMNGQKIIIPGIVNKLQRFMPKFLVMSMVAKMKR